MVESSDTEGALIVNVMNKGSAPDMQQSDAPGGTTSTGSKEPGGQPRRTLCAQMAELSQRHRLARKTMLELRSAGLPAGTRDVIRAVFRVHGVTLSRMDITGELLTHRPRPHAARSAS